MLNSVSFLRVAFVASLSLTLLACDKKPAPTGSQEAGAKTEKSTDQVPVTHAPGTKSAATPTQTAAAPTQGASTEPKPAAEVKAPSSKDDPAAKPNEGAAPSESPPKVSEAQCKAACDNVLKISMASASGKGAAKSMAAIEARVKADCPVQCLKHGTPESVKCLAAAGTASALADCPR